MRRTEQRLTIDHDASHPERTGAESCRTRRALGPLRCTQVAQNRTRTTNDVKLVYSVRKSSVVLVDYRTSLRT
jgi:hypothetical protein